MEKIRIKVNLREKGGKEAARKVRKLGNTPAVLYAKDTNLLLTVPSESMKTLKSIRFSESTIIDLELAGNKNETFSVLIKDAQYHPITESIVHIDFMKVSLTEKIKVNLPIVLKGEAKGIKDEGILEQVLWELTIEGLPLNIPERVEVDVTDLGIGDSIHVSDITWLKDLKIITAPQETVATVVMKKEEVIEVAPVEGAPTEPEVIKEKKEEEAVAEEKAEEGAKKEEPKKKEETKKEEKTKQEGKR